MVSGTRFATGQCLPRSLRLAVVAVSVTVSVALLHGEVQAVGADEVTQSQSVLVNVADVDRTILEVQSHACALPKPGDLDISGLDTSHRCPYWKPHSNLVPGSNADVSFCYHASPKSGSSVSLVMLNLLLVAVVDTLGYKGRFSYGVGSKQSILGMTLTVNHHEKTFFDQRIHLTKHNDPIVECHNIVTIRDPRDQIVSIWHYRHGPAPLPRGFGEQGKNAGRVMGGKQFLDYVRFQQNVLVNWQSFEGLLLMNFQTMVLAKEAVMYSLLDYMGFPWRPPQATNATYEAMVARVAEIAQKLSMGKSKTPEQSEPLASNSTATSAMPDEGGSKSQPADAVGDGSIATMTSSSTGGNDSQAGMSDTHGAGTTGRTGSEDGGSTKTFGSDTTASGSVGNSSATKSDHLSHLVHFRSGKARKGYLKELTPTAVRRLNEFLCRTTPAVAALWSVQGCPLEDRKWWEVHTMSEYANSFYEIVMMDRSAMREKSRLMG